MADPLSHWLAAQRELTERWLAHADSAKAGGALQDEMQRWWQSVMQHASPQAQALAAQLSQIGPAFLAGTGDALFELFGAGATPGDSATNASRWMDIAPVGYFREHQAHAQELAKALVEYQRVAADMSAAIAHIHALALEMLASKTQALVNAGTPVTDSTRLYELWIECGEQAFVQHARGESFGRLQGQMVNAMARVRMAQQTIADQFMRSLDLPTRAELNSVHRRLKELRDRIEQLEAERNSER